MVRIVFRHDRVSMRALRTHVSSQTSAKLHFLEVQILETFFRNGVSVSEITFRGAENLLMEHLVSNNRRSPTKINKTS